MWGTLIPILIASLGLLKGGGGSGGASGLGGAELDPMMKDVLGEQKRRMTGQGPLFDAIQQLAMNLMPKNVQRGLPGLGPVVPRTRTTSGPHDPNDPDDLPPDASWPVPPPPRTGGGWTTPEDLRRKIGRRVPD